MQVLELDKEMTNKKLYRKSNYMGRYYSKRKKSK